jgi:hypothetical protein
MRTRIAPGYLQALWAVFVWQLGCLPIVRAEVQRCTVRSVAAVPTIVELYTSEGCSSCPPADRWMSSLKGNPNVIAMGFHIDYWDGLGWPDRFARTAYTARQAREQLRNGASFSYTPQVVLNGRDYKQWRRQSIGSNAQPNQVSSLEVTLVREGDLYWATIAPVRETVEKPAVTKTRATHLAAYWTLTEDNHVTVVKAGENRGARLNHDFVVRDYAPEAPWEASRGAMLQFKAKPVNPSHPRHVNLVIVDTRNGQPVQAVKSGC